MSNINNQDLNEIFAFKAWKEDELIEVFGLVINKLSLLRKATKSFIQDYVSDIKNKIDISREKLFENAHSASDEMFKNLKKFDDSLNPLISQSESELDKLENLWQHWKKELHSQQTLSTNSKLKESIAEKRIYLEKTIQKFFVESAEVLNNKGCYFEPKIIDANFGKLTFDQLKITDQKQKYVCFYGPLKTDMLCKCQTSDLLNLCEFDSDTKFSLLYKATVDGFHATNFHSKCDGIPKTLTIVKVKSNANIFGGYTEATWDGNEYKKDDNAFIFYLVNKKRPAKIKFKPNESAIYASTQYGPSFNPPYYTNGFKVESNSNDDLSCCSGLKDSQNKYLLERWTSFSTSEIEVYKVE